MAKTRGKSVTAGTVKPGQRGNPKGRPKGARTSSELRSIVVGRERDD